MTTPLQQAAQDLLDRWDSPSWKDQPHTAEYIAELRKALDAEIAQSVEPVAWIKLNDDGRTGALFHQNEGWKDASELVPLYLHPPQPHAEPEQSGERAELIARLAKQWAELDPADPYRADIGKAADMLEADAQQAKRVPMTDDEIDEIGVDYSGNFQVLRDFARAIEAHRGITEPAEKPTVDEPEEEDLYALALKADNWGQP